MNERRKKFDFDTFNWWLMFFFSAMEIHLKNAMALAYKCMNTKKRGRLPNDEWQSQKMTLDKGAKKTTFTFAHKLNHVLEK